MKLCWITRLSLIGVLLVHSMASVAAEVENSHEQSTVIQNSQDKTTVAGSAKDWNLSDTEWLQYQTVMQGPFGLWYRNLSPPAVLGMRADKPEEVKYFAEVYAKQEHEKVSRELVFNNEVFKAMQRLYPSEPMIKPFDITPFNPMNGK